MNQHRPVDCYTNTKNEITAVRSAIGISDLSYRGRLRVNGPDRSIYLNRIVSNAVEGLSVGQGNYNLILTNRGKIISDMTLVITENEIDLMTTSSESKKLLHTELDKYQITEDITITDLTHQSGIISINGPKSTDLAESILDCSLDDLDEHHSIVRQIHISSSMAQEWVTCVRVNETGEVGYNLLVEKASLIPELWQKLLDKGQSYQIPPVGLSALEILRIEAGIPKFGAELDDSIIPLEAELDRAISFDKGCYIGQEIVARMKYRGHPNKLLRGLEIEADQPPQPGDQIFDGSKLVGRITSTTKSISFGQTIAMCYIRNAYTDQGSTVEVKTNEGRKSGRVVLLPFSPTLPLSLNR